MALQDAAAGPGAPAIKKPKTRKELVELTKELSNVIRGSKNGPRPKGEAAVNG